ncbi:MAG: type I 3-dehydroquinate dehydratase [Halobacteriales archaeon]|nr:type I 3-dehydroquinate dehydratase [Halobacteriales archaeon]
MEFGSFVLAASTADLADEPAARPHADAVEFRLDLADDPQSQLTSYDGELPLIATNRVRAEGGEAPAGSARLAALEGAVEHPAVGAVDLELSAVESGDAEGVVAAAAANDTSVIVSVHDFDATPARAELRRTLRAAAEAGDVGKLAVTARDRGDVLDLLAVTWELAEAGAPVATMAMGEAGRHSRAVAPLYGSRLGYAPLSPGDATAPGQYDLETLDSLLVGLGAR